MKKGITKSLIIIISIIMVFTLLINYILRIRIIHNTTAEKSQELFWQIETLIEANAEELSQIPTDRSTVLYAIDPESHVIIGCTVDRYIGRNAEELGFRLDGISGEITITHPVIDGKPTYCAVKNSSSFILARTYLESALYKQVLIDTWLLAIDIILLSALSIVFIYFYLDRNLVKGIVSINKKLHEIEQGNFNVSFSEHAVPELAELSDHINAMLKSVLSSSKKISIALELSKLPIGIYEYIPGSKRVQATSRVKDILMLTDEEVDTILAHPELIPEKETELKRNPVNPADNIYKLSCPVERYIRFEEFTYEESNLAILIDVTQEIQEKRRIEQERDIEPLTGLFNRRAFYMRMEQLFHLERPLKHGAMMIMDADRLKETNDLYGHRSGDFYLQKLAQVISVFVRDNAIAARLGGDEFALFLYNYSTKKEIDRIIEMITHNQDRHTLIIENGIEVTLHFSIGCSFYPEDSCDYHVLMKLADERMYQNKKRRSDAGISKQR